jgi:NAD(P)H dehydrogenase (quinone)
MYQKVGQRGTRTVRILVLFAHPGRKSFNHAILERVRKSVGVHEVIVHDLYEQNFAPVLTEPEILRRFSFDPEIQDHVQHLRAADALVVIHPDWWGQPPAILKGWLDRVLGPGTAYDYEGPEFGRKHARPLLSHIRGLVFVTSDADPSKIGPLFDMIWQDRVFSFCGIQSVAVEVFGDMRNATPRVRSAHLKKVERLMCTLTGEPDGTDTLDTKS